MSNGTDEQDSAMRTWAVVMAANHVMALPRWRRPASPISIARELYDFAKAAGKPGKLVAINGGQEPA